MATERGPVGDLVRDHAEAAPRHEFVTLAGRRRGGASELIAADELPDAASESVLARDGSIVRLIVRVPREALRLPTTDAFSAAQGGRGVDQVSSLGVGSSANRLEE
jgi:hypothetical protein